MTRIPSIQKIDIDCRGQQCPAPVLAVARAVTGLDDGGFVRVLADDPAFPQDIHAWCRSANAEIASFEERSDHYEAMLRVGELVELESELLESLAVVESSFNSCDAPIAPHRTPTGHAILMPTAPLPGASAPPRRESDEALSVHQTFDMRGEQCPGPIVALAKGYVRAAPGALIRVLADDEAFPLDLDSWIGSASAELVSLTQHGAVFDAVIRVGPSEQPVAAQPPSAAPSSTALAERDANHDAPAADGCTLLVLHNDHEALLAALLVANGAAAQGMKTTLFFTFWGLNLLRGEQPNLTEPKRHISLMQRMMKWMMPKGPERQPLGQMHFGGAGKGMLGSIMRNQNLMMLPELMQSAQELGVRFVACTMSMSVMGITRRDLYPYPNLEYGGVSAFVGDARQSSMSLVF